MDGWMDGINRREFEESTIKRSPYYRIAVDEAKLRQYTSADDGHGHFGGVSRNSLCMVRVHARARMVRACALRACVRMHACACAVRISVHACVHVYLRACVRACVL